MRPYDDRSVLPASIRAPHRDPDERLQDAEGGPEGRVRSEARPQRPAGGEHQAALSAPRNDKKPASAGFLFTILAGWCSTGSPRLAWAARTRRSAPAYWRW